METGEQRRKKRYKILQEQHIKAGEEKPKSDITKPHKRQFLKCTKIADEPVLTHGGYWKKPDFSGDLIFLSEHLNELKNPKPKE